MMKHTKHLLVLWAALLLGAGNAWGATGTVSITSFSTTSGDIGSGFTYSTYKGNATSAPAVNSSAIRLYQGTTTNAGGLLVVKAPSGYTITAVAIKSTMATTVGYVEGVEFTTGQKQSTMKANGKSAAISANGIFTASGLSCDVITFACLGTSSSSRLYLASITVTYETGSTEPTFILGCFWQPLSLCVLVCVGLNASTLLFIISLCQRSIFEVFTSQKSALFVSFVFVVHFFCLTKRNEPKKSQDCGGCVAKNLSFRCRLNRTRCARTAI